MTFDEHMLAAAKDYCRQVLEQTDGNVREAAVIAGRNRTGFYQLLHRHELVPNRKRLHLQKAGWRTAGRGARV